MKKENLKVIIENYLFNNKVLTDQEINMIYDYVEHTSDSYLDSMINYYDDTMVKVDLPNDNVGPIYITKEYATVANKINDLATLIYDKSEVLAGYECFAAVCYILDCEFSMLE